MSEQPMGTDLMYCHVCNQYYRGNVHICNLTEGIISDLVLCSICNNWYNKGDEHQCYKDITFSFTYPPDSQKLDKIIELLQQILEKLDK